ncbi:hypothetical protein BH10PSE7_BH10PSE7_17930 [soil metagenome]
MAFPVFDGARLKIDRARKHVADLESAVDKFMAEKPFELLLRQDNMKEEVDVLFKEHRVIPLVLSALIGDAIHNLRSCLDHAIFALVGSKAMKPSKVQFPFSEYEKDFEGILKGGELALAGNKVFQAIRDLKPYGDGNRLLHAVHAMDIQDKHRDFILAGRVVSIVADDLVKIHPAFGRVRGEGILAFTNIEGEKIWGVKTSQLSPRAQRRANAKQHGRYYEKSSDYQPPMAICFGRGERLDGQQILPTLQDMTKVVVEALNTLQQAVR